MTPLASVQVRAWRYAFPYARPRATYAYPNAASARTGTRARGALDRVLDDRRVRAAAATCIRVCGACLRFCCANGGALGGYRYQIVRVFVLARVAPKQLGALPGMAGVAAVAAVPTETTALAPPPLAADAGVPPAAAPPPAPGGAGPPPPPAAAPAVSSAAAAALSGVDAAGGAIAPVFLDSQLSGSNVYSNSELLLLRWLTVHYRAVAGGTRTMVDFDADLRDGTVFAALLLSHAPLLGEPGGPLAAYHAAPAPGDDTAALENHAAVAAGLRALGLDAPLAPEAFLAPDSSSPAAGPPAPTPLPPSCVELGPGNARDKLLAVLSLYQNLPQLIPKTIIEFRCAAAHAMREWLSRMGRLIRLMQTRTQVRPGRGRDEDDRAQESLQAPRRVRARAMRVWLSLLRCAHSTYGCPCPRVCAYPSVAAPFDIWLSRMGRPHSTYGFPAWAAPIRHMAFPHGPPPFDILCAPRMVHVTACAATTSACRARPSSCAPQPS